MKVVALALERMDAGDAPDLDALCDGDVELAKAVGESLGLAPRLRDMQSQAATMDRMVDTVLDDRYRLDSRIGAGAMGLVYRASDRELGRDVAVKLLRSDLLAGDTAIARFDREAEALATLRHPNVVTVYDRGTTSDGIRYLVMELLQGRPLVELIDAGRGDPQSYLPESKLPPSWTGCAATWIASLADGVQAAHDAGISHRDVKPSNVLVRPDGQPVLIDFGIATVSGEQTLATRDGTLGTPAYMAPEQVRGGKTATPQVDVYGLGATLYHLLAGRPPFAGSLSEVLRRIERSEPKPLHHIAPRVPRDLRAITEKAMAQRPSDRYPTATALAEDLRAFLDYRPASARPTGPVRRLARRARRSTAVRSVAWATVVLVALGIGLDQWASRNRQLATEASELAGQLRPDLSISGRSAARVLEQPELDAVREKLDRIVAHARTPLLGRTKRAAIRLDHGDPRGAAQDLQALAAHYATPFLDGLAQRYAALPDIAGHETKVTLTDLPQPTTAAGRYVAAFHVVRARSIASVEELLGDLQEAESLLSEDAGGGTTLAGAELRMMVLISLAAWNRQRPDVSQGYYRSAYRLAIDTARTEGRGTATTHYAAATALVGLGREAEAIAQFARAVERMPNHFGTRLNYASALRRVGELEAAEVQLRAAIALRPDNSRVLENLINLRTTQRDYAGAREALTSDLASSHDPDFLAALDAQLRLREVIHRYLASDDAGQIAELAAAATEAFGELDRPPSDLDAQFDLELAKALGTGDVTAAFDPMLTMLVARPDSWPQLRELAAICPADLSAQQTAVLKTYLLQLCERMAPTAEATFQDK